MAFQNKHTWLHAVQARREEELHRSYEAAVAKVKAALGRTHENFIGGREAKAASHEIVKRSPVDARVVVGRFPSSTVVETKAAIAAARAAFPAWRSTPWAERAALLDRTADRMTERFFELCAIMTVENGKNRFEAAADVDEAIDFCRHYAEQMRLHEGFVTRMGTPYPGEECQAVFAPYGVFAVIAPFNFPIAITTGMTVGALVTGNAVVLKPTVDAPLCGEAVYRCIADAGCPPGVLNVVHGEGSVVGQALVDSPDVDGYVFTGSKGVGMSIFHAANRTTPKPVIAEMGGKNPIIVTAKADLEKAVDGVFNAAFGFSGQKCSACSRLYVDRRVKDELLNRLVMKTMNAVVGDPAARDTFMGPLINKKAVATYDEAVKLARRDGRVLCGGEEVKDGDLAHGHFVAPTIVDGLPSHHELFRRELFVPFLAVDAFDTLDEALKKANDVEYGLTAGIFSEDEGEQQRFFDGIEAGVCYANRRRGGSTGAVVDGQTFVGWKNSGNTGRGAGGRNYLQQFMKEQSRTVVRG